MYSVDFIVTISRSAGFVVIEKRNELRIKFFKLDEKDRPRGKFQKTEIFDPLTFLRFQQFIVLRLKWQKHPCVLRVFQNKSGFEL